MKERLIGFLKTYFCLSAYLCCRSRCLCSSTKPCTRRLVDGMVSCDLAWVAAGLIPCRISDGCSRITFYRFCMGLSNLLRRIWCGYFILFLSYSLSYSPSIWDCMNIGASGWMLPLCSTSFPLPKMRWRASASGWWSEGFLQWASMRRFYMEYSIGCCCGKPFSDG